MAQDRRINLSHESNRFGQGHYDLLVVVQVFKGQYPAFAVLEPLVADLIAADSKDPHFERHAFKILLRVDINPPRAVLVSYLFHYLGARNRESGYEFCQAGRVHQVKGYQFRPQVHQGFKDNAIDLRKSFYYNLP